MGASPRGGTRGARVRRGTENPDASGRSSTRGTLLRFQNPSPLTAVVADSAASGTRGPLEWPHRRKVPAQLRWEGRLLR